MQAGAYDLPGVSDGPLATSGISGHQEFHLGVGNRIVGITRLGTHVKGDASIARLHARQKKKRGLKSSFVNVCAIHTAPVKSPPSLQRYLVYKKTHPPRTLP